MPLMPAAHALQRPCLTRHCRRWNTHRLRTKVAAAQVERDEAQRDAMNAQETAKQLIKQKAELEGALEAAKLR